MATTDLQADSANVTPTFRLLYNEYRHAKARWDTVLYAPEHHHKDVPDDIQNPLMDAHTQAMNRLLVHPAESAHQLVQKLEIYNLECLFNGWDQAQEISAALLEDARRVARAGKE